MSVNDKGLGDEIQAFICSELSYEPHEIARDTVLFTSGLVDSFTFVSLIALIETWLDRRIDPRDITVDHFDSIDRIIAFIDRAEA